jgi:uncharacterized membrane protein YeaQ/YmgE (transglycosylase-associated protein family)
MNIILWLLAGALLGWGGYSIMKLNESIGMLAATTLGAIAGILGGKEIAPMFSGAPLIPGGFSPSALFFALGTAAAVLVALHMVMARWFR